jgi:hypothetical protein
MRVAFLFNHYAVHQVAELETPECQCLKLRIEFELERLTRIHTSRGAGDREGGFDNLASGLGSALDDALPSHGHNLPRQE